MFQWLRCRDSALDVRESLAEEFGLIDLKLLQKGDLENPAEYCIDIVPFECLGSHILRELHSHCDCSFILLLLRDKIWIHFEQVGFLAFEVGEEGYLEDCQREFFFCYCEIDVLS
jgi:hypothetical protein